MIKNSKLYKSLASNKKPLLLLSLATFTILFFCSKMSPLYPVNEWSDINVYFNMGKAMFNGRTLYSEVFDHKGPLIFIIYGVGYLISNGSFLGMFLIELVLWLIMVYSIYFTNKFFLNTTFSIIVALLIPYSMLSFMHTGGSAEEFILVFEIVSLYCFIAYFNGIKEGSKHKIAYMLIHGAMSTMAMMIKINLILFWFFPLLAIFINLLVNKEYKDFAKNAAAYIGGVTIIAVPILVYFALNNATQDVYHVYIELNKQYSGTNDYGYLISNGFNRLFTCFRENLVWTILVLLGIIYFPYKYIKNIAGAVALTLAGISLIAIIFFPLTFHFYYPLPLCVFICLGLISIADIVQKNIDIRSKKMISYGAVILICVMAIGNRNLYGMGGAGILRFSEPTGPQFKFKNEILKINNPTLLNIAFGEGNSLFTTCNIVPSTKYFVSPNIYYNMFPDIRDQQTQYIERKEIDFVVSATNGFNYEYFHILPALKNNYTLMDSCEIRSPKTTYYLYKKNE